MNISGGSAAFEGLNAQVVAAFSLFLQYLKDDKFLYIHLESPHFQDFNLLFSNNKKIICESKKRKKRFSYPDLKKILENVQERLDENDEILIICENVNEELIKNISNIKYFSEAEEKFKNKGYSEKIIFFLSRVKFWIVPGDFNRQMIYSLLAEIVGFWLPSKEIKKIANDILFEKMYLGSAKSATYTKQEFLIEINTLALEAKKDSVYYNDEFKKLEEQFFELENALENTEHPAWKVSHELSALSSQMDLMSFVIERLASKDTVELRKWDKLWEINKSSYLTIRIFDIFVKNLYTAENIKYTINYCKQHAKSIQNYYCIGYFSMATKKLITKVLEDDKKNEYLKDVFWIIKELMINEKNKIFYLKNNDRDTHWDVESCKLLYKIYRRADLELKEEIFNYIISNFNITKDDGEFGYYTPEEIYKIILEYIEENFNDRFTKIVSIISEQYGDIYKKFNTKGKFIGWEHYGSGISSIGNNYSILDRYFIRFILHPAIKKYYEYNKIIGWNFIKEFCIFKEESVSKEKPDFLNRSVYKIVLDRYVNEDDQASKEAFEILQEYILSNNGIPLKSDLIYADLFELETSFEKKWNLVDLYLKKYTIPSNVFVEKIVADFANKGLKQAKEILKSWYSNPEYYKKWGFNQDYVSNIKFILETDVEVAAELLRLLIVSDYVSLDKGDSFNMFSIADLLHRLLKQNYAAGLLIFQLLESKEKLSNNEQIVYTASLINYGNKETEDPKLLFKIYKDVAEPFLNKYRSNEEIIKRLPNAARRGELVNFAEKLATNKYIAEALNFIRVFINDPDPCIQSERIEQGESPSIVESVRGRCGLALNRCLCLESREQIQEIIQLTEKLINDENYYVIFMASYSLSQLTENRLKVLSTDSNILFFNDDMERALLMAKRVETIAFNLLDKFISWPPLIQKAMVGSIINVFNPIRALNEQEAFRFITALECLPLEIMANFSGFFIYFAELRKYAYDDWKFKTIGLYDNLGSAEFDNEQFKRILIETIQNMQKDNPINCFQFASCIEYMLREHGVNNKEIYRENIIDYTIFALKYFDLLSNKYALNVFNLIYQVINTNFHFTDEREEWFSLLIKCLNSEKRFYEKKYSDDSKAPAIWDATLYHSKILEYVYENMGQDKFMAAVQLYLSLPSKVALHESEKLVSIITVLATTDSNLRTDAKALIDKLFDKNPRKYFELKSKIVN